MKLTSIDLEKTERFSKLFTDYINRDTKLNKFFGHYPTIENFEKQIEEKNFSSESRKVLCDVLTDQYLDFEKSDTLSSNLELLARDNTYTVTTGHQLNIFTGPLYFIYKIVTVVTTCRELAKKYPDCNFVPVYWMASEDHDYDEISYFWLYGSKHKWSTDQSGAVGRFTTEALAKLCDEIPGMPSLFKEAYSNYDSLAKAGRCYVNSLFGEQGLVVVDADDHRLKSLFIPVIEDDVFNHTANKVVNKNTLELQELGYDTQVNPREINLFYLGKDFRERIEGEGEKFKVVNTEVVWNKEALKSEISDSPEKFSPNVILRPLYQEMVLPNLAYVGGPSEVAYWFQLKPIFDYFQVPLPMLMPRNFVGIIDHLTKNKIEKIGFEYDELFKPQFELEKEIALRTTDKQIELDGQKDSLIELFKGIGKQAATIDKTLVAHVEAQASKTASRLDLIEKKFIRAEKRKHSDKMQQLDAVLSVLFPANSLQERRDNFLNFYMQDPNFILKLLDALDPFDYRFHILLNG